VIHEPHCPLSPEDVAVSDSNHPTTPIVPSNRGGLTLVELLVAVGIIAMLVGLLTPALMGARKSALNAKVKAEIDLLHMAFMNYKSEYGSFPPAAFGIDPISKAELNNPANYKKHPVYRHLVRVFPRINEPASAYAPLAKMSPAQALVFWLRGFYENPEYPLTNGGAKGQRKKLFDFDESRLYAASEYVSGTAQTFAPRGDYPDPLAFERNYPVYFTGQISSGLPYVYFDSRCYDVQNNDRGYWAQSLMVKEVTVAQPYFTSTVPANPLWSQCHVNADTFQLIASGLDGGYGPAATLGASATDLLAAQAAYPDALSELLFTGSTGVVTYSFRSAGKMAGHLDNITNFAPKPLADAASSLKTSQ
jgi:type II secretory pathway pseudopilin PulG